MWNTCSVIILRIIVYYTRRGDCGGARGLRVLYFGFVPRRLAAEIGWRLVRRWRIRHGQYERLLPGRLELSAQLAQPEQHGRLLLRAGRPGRVDHGRQIGVHQLRVVRRQSENPCNQYDCRENNIRFNNIC